MRKKCFEDLKEIMKEFQFKKSDFLDGALICSSKYQKDVIQRSKEFQVEVAVLYKRFLQDLLLFHQKKVIVFDHIGRNPIHYSAFSKFKEYYFFFTKKKSVSPLFNINQL